MYLFYKKQNGDGVIFNIINPSKLESYINSVPNDAQDLSNGQKYFTCDTEAELNNFSDFGSEKLAQAKDIRINSRQSYLDNTDWYIARESDTPNSYPAEIKTKRIQARSEINTIENLTTLAEVEVYNETFE